MTEHDLARPLPIAGILLAAGGSSRMGRPKQLLMYRGQTLLRRAAEAAFAAGLDPVIVIIGDDPTGEIRAQLANLPVGIVPNPHWRAGMGTSIRAGMQRLIGDAPPARSSGFSLPSPGPPTARSTGFSLSSRDAEPAPARSTGFSLSPADRPVLAGVLLMLSDQPLITPVHLRRLIEVFRASGKSLAAAAYHQTLGPPALFAPKYFPALLNLPDNSGAKPILLAHSAEVESVSMPEAATDIDTPDSYRALTELA